MASDGAQNPRESLMSFPALRSLMQLGKMSGFLLLLPLLLLSSSVRGEIHCMCNTPDCQQSRATSCVAKYYCFIEYAAVGRHYKPTFRGCIDERTPLNCERFVPQDPTGRTAVAWPKVYCCSDGWCNLNINRRVRPKQKRKKGRPLEAVNGELLSTTQKPSEVGSFTSQISTRPKFGRTPQLSPNPAHVAVPVAGAFFVLSLIVLVVILVRRKEAEDSNRARASKYQSVPASIAARMKPVGANDNPYETPPIPLYASVGHKPSYPLCPVVPRQPL